MGGAGGGPDDVVEVVEDVGHSQDAELLDEGDRVGDADDGDVEIAGPDVLDHFRFVAELAGGEKLNFDPAAGTGLHDFPEAGADGPHFGVDGIAEAHLQDRFFL